MRARGTVSSDEDCGWGANGANADNCCGGISWAPQGGTVGYFNDVTCGYVAGRDQDCGLPNPQGVRMRDETFIYGVYELPVTWDGDPR